MIIKKSQNDLRNPGQAWEPWKYDWLSCQEQGTFQLGSLFAFTTEFLLPLTLSGHRALPLSANSNIVALLRSQGVREEYPCLSLCSTQYICIYQGRNNISICKKQLLPSGLQHPRIRISPTSLIYFPVCVPEVWKELLKLLLFPFLWPQGGKYLSNLV